MDYKKKPIGLAVHRVGHWLPSDHRVIQDWLKTKVKQIDPSIPLNPVLANFQKMIESDPTLSLLATQMFTEVPITPPYNLDPTGKPEVRDYHTMFQLFNLIMLEAPQWYETSYPGGMGLIGFPFNAILDWPMGTSSGYVFLLRDDVNAQFKLVLDAWGQFLSTDPKSALALNEANGWLSPNAQAQMAAKGNDGNTNYTFTQLYDCPDVTAPTYGFKTWDAFFTRKFNPGIRPVAAQDDSRVIINSCESAPFRLSTNVKLQDEFWLKGQPYSLVDMLDRDEVATQFVGGTVYQAFLSALSYHRWNSPVDGTIVGTKIVIGSYYSENYWQGFANQDGGPDPAAANNSQPYLAEVATRGILYIQADNPAIGLMAVVYIGMAEVSTCDFRVKNGQRVRKGDEVGMFHFGGSTHCIVFRPETQLKWVPTNIDPDNDTNYPVNSALAVVIN